MALEDQLGAVDPQGVVAGLIGDQMPEVVQNGTVEPQTVLNRLIRKGLDQRGQRRLQRGLDREQSHPDLGTFGKTPDELANEPAQPQPDFSSFGQETDTTPPQPKDGWGGYGSTAVRSAARGAVEGTGSALKGVGLALQPPAEPESFAPPPPDQRVDETDLAPKAQKGPQLPTPANPLSRAGQSVQEFGERNIPLTPTEQDSITGRASRMVGGFLPLAAGMAVGDAVAGPPGAIATGAGMMAAQSGSSAYDEAIAKGADEATAAKAAGLNAIVGGALGTLPLGVILAPVRAAAPGLMGIAATALEKAVRSGLTFTTIGEAQEFVSQQIAKELYDPKAGYSPDAKRIIASLVGGGIIGAAMPPYGAHTPAAGAAAAPGSMPAAAPGARPGGPGAGAAAGGAGAGAGPGPRPGTGPQGGPGTAPGGAEAKPGTPPPPFETQMRPKLRKVLEAKAAYYKEHSAEDIASWSDDQLKEYVNVKFGGGSARSAEEPQQPEQPKPQEKPKAAAEPFAPDQPSAEPMSDLKAQVADLNDDAHPRAAVWLPASNVAHLKNFDLNNDLIKHNAAIENFDGKGGVLIARDQEVAEQAVADRDAGVQIQSIVGKLTGAGEGKPTDATVVVQQRDQNGNVTRERGVAKADVDAIKKEFAAPGRTVHTLSPQDVQTRRAELIAAELKARKSAGTREKPVEIKSAEDIARAADVASKDYSPEQGEANNVQRGHVTWNGLEGTMEVAAGGSRKGTNPKTGKRWKTTHTVPYGYWKGTVGGDGMHVDVYWGPEPDAGHPVFVLDERDDKSGEFRQHKTFVGFASPQDAIEAYLGTSTKKPEHIGGMRALDPDVFTRWVTSGDTKKALSDAMGRPVETPGNKVVDEAGTTGARVAAGASPAAPNATGATEAAARSDHAAADDAMADLASIFNEAGPEHHAAIEDALTKSGVDPAHIRPADIARAAEIHATEGAPPDQAFPVAVLRNLVDDGHITPEAVKEAVGDAAAQDILEGGDRSERGLRAPPQRAATGGAAAEGTPGVDPRSQQGGEAPVAEEPARGEARGIERGEGDGAAGHPEERGRVAADAASGERHAADQPGRSGEERQPAGETAGAAERKAAAHAEDAVTEREPPKGYEIARGPQSGTYTVTDPDGHAVHGTFVTRDDAVAEAEYDQERHDAEQNDDQRDDLHDALRDAKIPLDTVLPKVEARAILIMARDSDLHPLDALEAALIQVEREMNNVPEQLWLALDIPKGALDAIDELKPSRAGEGAAADSGDLAEGSGERSAQEREPAPGAGESAGDQSEASADEARATHDVADDIAAKPPAVEMYLEVGDKRYQIADYKEASDKVSAARDAFEREGHGSSDFASPTIVDSNGRIIAHVSWNGRVWPGRPGRPGDPGDWEPGTKPLYDNRKNDQKAPASPGPSDSEGSFDADTWSKERDDRIAASKRAGNTHLDQLDAYVETMRGRAIYNVHDPKERGVVRTVANTGEVVIHWSDAYSAEKNLATEKTEGKKQVHESWLAPTDLKDYVVDQAGGRTSARAAKEKPEQGMVARTLKDMGAEPIDGRDSPDERPSGPRKKEFLTDAAAYLRTVAGALKDKGFAPHPDKKGKPGKPVSTNEGGVAVSGEVHLELQGPGSVNVYVTIGGAGVPPARANGTSLMARVSIEKGDRYANKGSNTWLSPELTAGELADKLTQMAERSGVAKPASKELPAKENTRADTVPEDQAKPAELTIRGRRAITDYQRALADLEAGKLKQDPAKEGACYPSAGRRAIDESDQYVIGLVNTRTKPIYHAIVATTDATEGAPKVYYADPTLTFDGWFGEDVFHRVVDGFVPVHRMTGGEVRRFGLKTGKYPDPATLKLPSIAAVMQAVREGKAIPGPQVADAGMERPAAPEGAKLSGNAVAAEDDFDKAFDQGLANVAAKQAPKSAAKAAAAPRVATPVQAKPAAAVEDESAQAMADLTELFNGEDDELAAGMALPPGAGPRAAGPAANAFEPELYARARPLLQKAAAKFAGFSSDVAAFVPRMVEEMNRAHGLTGAGLERMRPYLRQFVQDLRAGVVKLGPDVAENPDAAHIQDEETGHGGRPAEQNSHALDDVPSGEGGGAEGGGASERGDAGRGAPGAGGDRASGEGSALPGARGGRGGAAEVRVPDAGAGRRPAGVGARRTRAKGKGVPGEPASVTPSEAPSLPGTNFHITRDVELGRGTELEKFNDNLDAIQTLKAIERDQRRATPDEQRSLARYVGWGGLANAFADRATGEFKTGWEKRGKELADLLTPQEMRAARSSTRNAHYTSETVVRAMWDIAKRLGFNGGLTLELSAGTGNFLGLIPEDVAGRTKFIAVEQDSITSRIAKLLYPQATVLNAGLQEVPLSDGEAVLNIGNPPFGSESLRFQFKPELYGLSIHNQFFLAGIDAVRPGGLQIAVVSRYLLDAQDEGARRMLAAKADLIGAIRLPDSAFKENARTEVVTDIVVLQRREPADETRITDAYTTLRNPKATSAERSAAEGRIPSWVKTTTVNDPLGGEPITVNTYFAKHKNMIAGTLERSGTMRHGGDVTVSMPKGTDLNAALQERIGRLPKDVMGLGDDVIERSLDRHASMAEALEIAVAGNEPGHVETKDGKLLLTYEKETPSGGYELARRELSPESPWSRQLYMDDQGRWFSLSAKTDAKGQKVKAGEGSKRNVYERQYYDDNEVPGSMRLGKQKFERLQQAVELRDLVRRQLVLESNDAPAADMEGNRKALAKAYKAYVGEHGLLNDQKNASLLSDMPDGALVLALELGYRPAVTDARAARTGEKAHAATANPAPIMSRRVVPKYEPATKADTPADALSITLSERGRVDLERIGSLLGITPDEAAAKLQEGAKPLVFFDPESNLWDTRDGYLSGQVARKLNAAKVAGLERNIKELEAVQPAAWTADQINAQIGSTWVPPHIYGAFAQHLVGGEAQVRFAPVTNSFSLRLVTDPDPAKVRNWQTDAMRFEPILSGMLNSRVPKVIHERPDGSTYVDQEASALVALKAKEIENEFADWVFNDAARRADLVRVFNEKFNTRVTRQHEGSHLQLPGKVPDEIIRLRRHQKNAVWRGIHDRFMLYDHVVGAGKTFTAIARAMERRRMGLSRKPMVAVPNHLVEQWASDVYRLYPGAKILAAGRRDFERGNRRRLFAKIATGDWDLVIVPHSSFAFIGIAPETELRFLDEELRIAQEAVEAAQQQAEEDGLANGRRKPFNVKEAERLVTTIETRMERLKKANRDRLLTFEQMGVDDLTVDEAHEFKNLFYSSRLTGVRGMGDKSGSQKAFDLYNKVRVLRESPNGSVTFMTGTPISNSAVEMFTMMRYLAAAELKELGLEHFDAWRAQSVSATSKFEPTEAGGLKEVTRLGRSWSNMRALMELYYSFTDSVPQEDITKAYAEDNNGAPFPVPRVKNGGRKEVVVKPTPAQTSILEGVIEGFNGLPGITDPYERNKARLRLMDRARKVSLDARAVDPRYPTKEEGGKLDRIADEVARIHKLWTPDRGTQLVFLDRSVKAAKQDTTIIKGYDDLIARRDRAKAEGDEATYRLTIDALDRYDPNEIAELRQAQLGGWNAYDQLKTNLIARGIPADEVRFVQEANSDAEKKAIFDAVNDGSIRVLIGSTPRMGAGTNVQERIVGLHHGDVTWKPSDIEQREGRGIRQGNKLLDKYGHDKFELEIKAYVTERTVDAKMWDLNSTKLRMINGIRKYDGSFTMEFEDEDAVGMAEIAALASGDPVQLERVKLTAEIDKLELMERAHRRRMFGLDDAIERAEQVVKEYPGRIEAVKAAAAELQAPVEAVKQAAGKRSATVEGKTYTHAMEAAQAAEAAIAVQKGDDASGKYAVTVDGARLTNQAAIEEALQNAFGDQHPFEASANGETFRRRSQFARAIQNKVDPVLTTLAKGTSQAIAVGQMFGGDVEVQLKRGMFGTDLSIALTKDGRTLAAARQDIEKATYSLQAARALLDGLEEDVDNVRRSTGARMLERIKEAEAELPGLRQDKTKPFAQAKELAEKRARLEAVINELAARTKAAEGGGGGGTAPPANNDDALFAGMALAPNRAVTETPAFLRWFGNSKAVDGEGKPLVVYHGTTAAFDTFDPARLGETTRHPTSKLGFFFSASPDGASLFTQSLDDSTFPPKIVPRTDANVMPVYLSVKNPFKLTVEQFREINARPFGKEFEAEQPEAAVRTRDWIAKNKAALIAKGYDGIHIGGDTKYADRFGGEEYAADAWVAFEPTQIKSATGNTGTFDPNNPSMVAMARPTPETAFRQSRGLTDLGEQRRLAELAKRTGRVIAPEHAVQPSGLTREAELRATDLGQHLTQLIHHITGKQIAVRFRDQIMAGGPTTGWGASSSRDPHTMGGVYLPLRDIVRIALADPRFPDRAATGFHEAWHAVEDHFVNEQEMALLKREEPRLREIAARSYGMTPDEAAGMSDFEIRAIAFQAYASDRANGGHGAGFHIGIRRIFERLMRLFRQIANYLRSLGFKTYEDVFSDTYEGKMKERPSRKLDEGEPSRIAESLLAERAKAAEMGAAMATAPRPRAAGTIRPSIGARIRDRIAAMLESRLASKIAEGFQDLSVPVRRLQEQLEERRGAKFSDLGDFYTRKRVYPGRVGNEVNDFNREYLDPLVAHMKAYAISLQAAGDYLYALHVPERNAKLGRMYPPDHQFHKAMYDRTLVGASGQSRKWADDILGEIDRFGRRAQYEEIANRIAAIREYVLHKLVDGGLITPATATEWRNQYQHYVDLRGFEDAPDEAPEDFREPARFNVRGKEIKQAFGRRSKADNPIVNMLDQAYRSIDRAERNRYLHAVWNALGRMNAENPDSISDIVKLDRGNPKKVIDPNTGLVKVVSDSSYAGSPNTVTTKIGGVLHHMMFTNRDIAEAVKRMAPDGLGVFQGLLNLENKLKSLWTHYSPDFLFRHFMFRYPIEGTLNSFEQKEGGDHGVGNYLRESLPFVGSASKAIFAAAKGVRHADPEIRAMQDYWQEMRKAGGAMMFRQSRDMDLLREHLQTQLLALQGKPIASAREKWRRAIEAMDVITNTLDNALRLAAFASARRQGKTPQQAALIAREATVDFQLKGKWSNAIGLWFPFGNVAIQTGMRMTKAVARSKIMRRVFMGTMLAGFLTAAFNYLIGGDDKDGVPFFEKIPEWDRRLNFILLNPFDRDEKGRPVPIKIPMPYNWAFPLMLGYGMGTRVFGKEAIRKTLGMVARSGLEVLTPFGQEENMAALLAPELSRPAIYLATNEDYSGRPIHTRPEFQKGPNAESGRRDIGGRVRTGEGWKYVASSVNKATGGSRTKSGWIDFYPEDYRQIFDYVGGTQRRLGQNIYETGKSVMQGKSPDPTHVPLERVIRGTDYDAADRSIAYERSQRVKQPWLH